MENKKVNFKPNFTISLKWIIIWIILFWGEPDLLDSLIELINKLILNLN